MVFFTVQAMKANRRNAWSPLLIVLPNGLIKRGGETELPSCILKPLMDWSSKTLIDALEMRLLPVPPSEERELFSGFEFKDIVTKPPPPPPHLFAGGVLKITRVRERQRNGDVEIKRIDFIADEWICVSYSATLRSLLLSSNSPLPFYFGLRRFRLGMD